MSNDFKSVLEVRTEVRFFYLLSSYAKYLILTLYNVFVYRFKSAANSLTEQDFKILLV